METDDEIRSRIRNILIELREDNGLTQTEVGEVVGKSKNAVASWEQGRSLPDLATLQRLAKYYHKTIAYMYGVEEPVKEPLLSKGTVRWFNGQKGYGFITNPDGQEVFAKFEGIAADTKSTKPALDFLVDWDKEEDRQRGDL